MAIVKNFRVTYEVTNVNTKVGGAGLAPGPKYLYRKGPQQANVAAANIAAIAGVIAGDLTLGAGETIEIIDAHEEPSPNGLFT